MLALVCFAVAVLSIAASAASAAKVELPLIEIETGVGKQGVDVGVSVPTIKTDINANVKTDPAAPGVGVEVRSPNANANANVGGGNSGTDAGSSQGSGPAADAGSSAGDAGQQAPRSEAAEQAPAARTAANDANRVRSTRGPSRQAAGGARSAEASTTPVAVLADAAVAEAKPPAAVNPSESSVVSRFVAYVPTWLWIVVGALAIGLLVAFAWALRERRRRRASDDLAMHDPLTGVANVKAFDDRLAQEFARARRYDETFGVLLIDLDNFKQVNDENGHAAGDEVLMATAQLLADRTRTTDLVARIGGDEFAVLCPRTDLDGLRTVRRLLESMAPEELGYGVGFSVGIAELSSDDAKPSQLVARADESMYSHKRSRRADRQPVT